MGDLAGKYWETWVLGRTKNSRQESRGRLVHYVPISLVFTLYVLPKVLEALDTMIPHGTSPNRLVHRSIIDFLESLMSFIEGLSFSYYYLLTFIHAIAYDWFWNEVLFQSQRQQHEIRPSLDSDNKCYSIGSETRLFLNQCGQKEKEWILQRLIIILQWHKI